MDELSFKIEIMNFFGGTPQRIINFEFPFDYNKRRCDVLILDDEGTTAIEIKSNIDKLTNLKEQLFSYNQAFNTIYVACGEKHINEIKSIKGRFGIIFVDKINTRIVRKPRYRKLLNSHMILDMLDKSILEKETGIKLLSKQELIDDIIKRLSPLEIQSIYYKVLRNKISPIYNIFLKEKGALITREDIALLTLKTTKLTIN
ncbi:sce7726 family protein [Pantoea sp. PGP6]